MDKFWEWMFKKEYAVDSVETPYITRKGRFIPGASDKPFTKHMLIGYMMEYLRTQVPGFTLKMSGRTQIVDIYYKLMRTIEKL